MMLSGLFLLLSHTLTPAHAKQVHIEWKEVSDSHHYEVWIETPGSEPRKIVTPKTHLNLELAPGIHPYKLRAVDAIDRPGNWSALIPLAVSPEERLKLLEPEKSAELIRNTQDTDTLFRWNPIPTVDKYHFILKKDGVKIQDLFTKETQISIPMLEKGDYTWSVSVVYFSAESEFEIELKPLKPPKLITPKGLLVPPKTGKLIFKWEPREGAKSYQFELTEESTQKKIITYSTTKTSLALVLPKEGNYRWTVKSLAKPVEGRGPASIHTTGISEENDQSFRLDRNALHVEGFGYVALSTMTAPYTYKIASPLAGFSGSTQSLAMTGRLSGEYWPGGSIGASFGLEDTIYTIEGQNFSRYAVESHLKYRIALSKERFGWFLSPKLGAEARQFQQLVPTGISKGKITGLSVDEFWVLGPSLGMDLRRQFSEKWSLGIKTAYFLPVSAFGGVQSDRVLGGPLSKRNWGAGAQALYWANKNWGLAAGGFYEWRSIGFQKPSQASGTQYESVSMDAVYFFGSLIFSFGR